MEKPDKPKDETARLNVLSALNILDTPAEERFDRLTRIAHELFGVPIALVSLVDGDRQWFKSSVGTTLQETPRDVSFCGHAILGDDIFVVNDSHADQRFADNPLVVNDPGIRFYAGCPLRAAGGSKLGTLCVIDRDPREFSARDRKILQDLAAMVEREIELTQLATIDELTGIANRRGFKLLAEKGLQFFHRKGLPASLVFFDLDQFKQINDTHGHAEGDRVLRLFAENMRSMARESDVTGRLGGDEFVILFADTAKDQVDAIMRRFDQGLVELYVRENLDYEIAYTHGIVQFDPALHLSIDMLLHGGDLVMYKRKKERKAKT